MEDPEKKVREYLLRVMEERGWSRSQLAKAAGVASSTLQSIIDDKQPVWPSSTTLAKIAAGLGTSVAALVSDKPAIGPVEALQILREAIQPALSPTRRKLDGALAALDDDQLETVLRWAREIPIATKALNEAPDQAHRGQKTNQRNLKR